MKVISFLSDFCMPFVVCWIVIYGWLGGCPVFDVFVKGAKRGLRPVAGILPTLIGLMAAVRILRDSGLLDRIAGLLSPLAGILRIPAEVLPLLLVKMFSASAATGILLDIFKNSGPDSYAGMLAAVIASSTETVLFVMSVYLTHVHIRKSRWILPVSMLCMLAGVLAAVWVTGLVV